MKQRERKTEKLFVYGTLMKPLMRAVLCSRLVPAEAVALEGYRKEGLNIIPDKEEWVPGAMFELSKRELERIDKYERIPRRYTRKKLTVSVESVWVYMRKE